MLTGQNGILNGASEAKEKTEAAQKDEIDKMSAMEETINNNIKSEKTALELFDATGEIEGKLHIGDFVNYTPTDEIWTEDDMNKIKSSGTKIEANKSKTELPNTGYQFGGFAVGDSKSGNAREYNLNYSYIKDSEGKKVTGWRIFDVAEDGAVTLISAGCPEDYFQPSNSALNASYISEYILTGSKNGDTLDIDFTAYTPRDWTMYENTNIGSTAGVLTKEKLDCWYAKYITKTTATDIYTNETFRKIYNTKYEGLIDNYSYYWLSTAYYNGNLHYVDPNYMYVSGGNSSALGIRVLISLPSNIKIKSAGSEKKTVISRENNTQRYNVWDLTQ